jgi:molecular chaperone GrpE (heat shock protein)
MRIRMVSNTFLRWKTQTKDLVDTYFRLAADFDNFRKRAESNLVQSKVSDPKLQILNLVQSKVS